MDIPIYDIKGLPVPVPPDLFKLQMLYDNQYKNSNTPLVIDNGTFTVRAGWGGSQKPLLNARNIVARQKNVKDQNQVLVGSEIPQSDIFKLSIKSPFQKDVIQHFHSQQHILDYVFSSLGIRQNSINHPILITETVCSPNYSRKMLLQILFECYQVPSVNLGIDGLFSFYQHSEQNSGLIVNLGHQVTHVLPVINGQFLPSQSRRINVGGWSSTFALLKYLHARYFYTRNLISWPLAQQIVYSYCYTALDYRIQLETLRYNNKVKIQLPWVMTQHPTQEEIKKKTLQRKEQGKRLREISVKKNEEKKRVNAQQLQELEVLAGMYRRKPGQFQQGLIARGISNYQDLKKKINLLKSRLNLSVDTPQRFALLEIPDQDLTPQQVKQKKMQKIQKSAQQARQERKKRLQGEKEKIEKMKQENPQAYLQDLHRQRQEVVDRTEARTKVKQELSNRHSRTSQRRLRKIAELGAERKDDNFGVNDQDWDVYREIQKDTLQDQEQDLALLAELDSKIAKLDANHLINIGEVWKPPSAEDFQILIDVDRVRPPQILFQPSITGSDQAGLSLVLQQVFGQFQTYEAQMLASNILVCGGPSLSPGFAQRLEFEIRKIRPFQSNFRVQHAADLASAWKGASLFADTDEFRQTSMTRQDYEERGGVFCTENQHICSNLYFQTPSQVDSPKKKH